MPEDLVEIIQKFSLSNKELEGAILDEEDVDTGIMECQLSLIGRIKGAKVANYTGVKNFVTMAWSYPRSLKVAELGPNLFQFTIPDRQEMERILSLVDRQPNTGAKQVS